MAGGRAAHVTAKARIHRQRPVEGPRVASLYDPGGLQDPYRVASFVGLGGSLIAVSQLSQRFVFRRPAAVTPAPM